MGRYKVGDSPLLTKSCAFAARITNMVDYLRKTSTKSMGTVYTQILRSGTSVMANVSEAQFAQSQDDFISKFHISLKEASETRNWLWLLYKANDITEHQHASMRADCDEIIAMLVSSLKTAKRNQLNDKITRKGK